MTPQEFCYWLQGFFELSESNTQLSPKQVQAIRNHLSMVFAHHIDPQYGDNQQQKLLQQFHDEGFDAKPVIKC